MEAKKRASKKLSLAKYEHHDWGYFVFTDKKAIAVVSHEPRRVQAALEELGRST